MRCMRRRDPQPRRRATPRSQRRAIPDLRHTQPAAAPRGVAALPPRAAPLTRAAAPHVRRSAHAGVARRGCHRPESDRHDGCAPAPAPRRTLRRVCAAPLLCYDPSCAPRARRRAPCALLRSRNTCGSRRLAAARGCAVLRASANRVLTCAGRTVPASSAGARLMSDSRAASGCAVARRLR